MAAGATCSRKRRSGVTRSRPNESSGPLAPLGLRAAACRRLEPGRAQFGSRCAASGSGSIMKNNRWLNTVGRQGIQRLRQKGRLVWLASSITLAACAEVPTESEQHESQTSAALTISKLHDDQPVLETQLIAKRIPGAGAVAEIGLFLPGGAVHDTFARYTAEGAVFAPGRVLVASTSNFGARLATPDAAPGS